LSKKSLQKFSKGWSFTFKPKTAALVFEDSAIRTFNNSWDLEIESWVHFANLKLKLWGLDFRFASEFMGAGSGALLKVWWTPLHPFSASFEFKKMELVEISIQMPIYAIGGRASALPSAPGESVFRQD
jgi:hypothetical protein